MFWGHRPFATWTALSWLILLRVTVRSCYHPSLESIKGGRGDERRGDETSEAVTGVKTSDSTVGYGGALLSLVKT